MLVRKVIPVVDTLCFPKQGTKFSRSVIFRNEGVGEWGFKSLKVPWRWVVFPLLRSRHCTERVPVIVHPSSSLGTEDGSSTDRKVVGYQTSKRLGNLVGRYQQDSRGSRPSVRTFNPSPLTPTGSSRTLLVFSLKSIRLREQIGLNTLPPPLPPPIEETLKGS